MARLTVGKGIQEYVDLLKSLDKDTRMMIGRALYEGADEVADAIVVSIATIPIDNRLYTHGGMLNGISQIQKKGLIDGFGIAQMRNDNGKLNVKVGFNGYNGQKTHKYPGGQPNVLIARSLEGGTSYRIKIPFISRAVRKSTKKAEERMKVEIDRMYYRITGGRFNGQIRDNF